MAKEIEAQEFLEYSKSLPILDVRSPAEYEFAHIPGALSFPLFDNEERAKVGTIYKQQGKNKAIIKGLEFVGPKMASFVKEALALKSDKVLLHCWRGGMRSRSMAWLFEQVGLEPLLLKGGYKSYRVYIRERLSDPIKIILLGGYTGSGKTDLLKLLEQRGEQVVDLEGIAHHKGSAFGAIGELPQPSTEMFENLLFAKIESFDLSKPVWVEDESHNVGKIFIPEPFWLQMRNSPLVVVEAPFKCRLERLLRDYGSFSGELLAASIKKIEKRLGYDKCKEAVECCLAGELERAAEITLLYYDKAYQNQLENRFGKLLDSLPRVLFSPLEESDVVNKLMKISNTITIINS